MTHPDSAPMVMDRLERMYALQAWLVLEGMLEAVACLAAICCIMSLKSQVRAWRFTARSPPLPASVDSQRCQLLGFR
jgi:hypothetical protein